MVILSWGDRDVAVGRG